MAEYIDKQKALAAIQIEREYMTRRQEWLADHILAHCGYRIIEGMPTADVEPVRHGRWIKGGYACGETEWICSECGFSEWRTSNSRMIYCMNCGARMDGEQDGKL